MSSERQEGLGEGVVYRRRDHAHPIARVLIFGIDLIVVWILFSTGSCLIASAFGPWTGWIAALAAAYVYLVPIQAGPGTIGLGLFGCRFVSLRGQRPSLVVMTVRLLLWMPGPIHPLVDLLWVAGDERRRTLRDLLVGTYIIRRRAEPVGTAPIRAVRWSILGMQLVVPEVVGPSVR